MRRGRMDEERKEWRKGRRREKGVEEGMKEREKIEACGGRKEEKGKKCEGTKKGKKSVEGKEES